MKYGNIKNLNLVYLLHMDNNMKKSELRQIFREEIQSVLKEEYTIQWYGKVYPVSYNLYRKIQSFGGDKKLRDYYLGKGDYNQQQKAKDIVKQIEM